MSCKSEKAVELFEQGYNCSQAVFCAFADDFGFDKETALRISSGFGGGFGRMREVCGAFSGITMLLGLATDTDFSDPHNAKTEVYAQIRALADEFREKNGSLVCRELLEDVPTESGGVPEKRTAEYYQKRPCKEIVREAAIIIEKYLNQ